MRNFVEISIFDRKLFGELKYTHIQYILLTLSPNDMKYIDTWHFTKKIYSVVDGIFLDSGNKFTLSNVSCFNVGDLEGRLSFTKLNA